MDREEAEHYASRFDKVLTTTWRSRTRLFAQGPVPPSQFLILRLLKRQAPWKVSELANLLNISSPAVSNMLSELERSGHILRYDDSADRRVTLVDLTSLGRTVVDEEENRRSAQITRMLEHFDVVEIEMFLQVCARLLQLGTDSQKEA